MDTAALLERVLDRPRVVVVRATLDAYGRAAGGLLANGLAFSAMFATIPMALVTLGLAGWLVDDPRLQSALARLLAETFPPLAELIDGALEALTTGAPVTSIVGLIGLVWTVSQLYVALDVAFARIFAAEPERGVVGRTARGLAWVAILLAAVVVIIVVGALAAAADALLPEGFALGRIVVTVLTTLPVLLVLALLLLAVVYRVLPPRAPSWRAIRPVAVTVGLVIVAFSQVFALLAPRLVGVASVAGPLATAFAALVWLSLSFQALLLGAAWLRVRDDRERGGSALAGAAAPAEAGVRGEG